MYVEIDIHGCMCISIMCIYACAYSMLNIFFLPSFFTLTLSLNLLNVLLIPSIDFFFNKCYKSKSSLFELFNWRENISEYITEEKYSMSNFKRE